MASSIQIKHFGKKHSILPLSSIQSIGSRSGYALDSIIVNGNDYNYSRLCENSKIKIGGDYNGETTLLDDEYIVAVKTDTVDIWKEEKEGQTTVSAITFLTNKGNVIGREFGGCEKKENYPLHNIRLLAIGAKIDRYVSESGFWYDDYAYLVSQLDLQYIKNYTPSTIVEKNVSAIVSFQRPGSKYVTYTQKQSQTAYNTSLVTKTISEQTYSASIKAEFSASIEVPLKVAQAGVNNSFGGSANTTHHNYQEATRKSSDQYEKLINKEYEKTETIGHDEVGVAVATAIVKKGIDDDGKEQYWIAPTSNISYINIKIDGDAYRTLLGYYDFTGNLAAQLGGLKEHRTKKRGHVFYEKSKSDSEVIDHFGRALPNRLPLEPIKSIGVRCGSALDNIIINGKKIGGNGGNASIHQEVKLGDDEYIIAVNISTIKIWDKEVVSPVTFLTSKGKIIGFRFKGSDKKETYSLNNIKLLKIGADKYSYHNGKLFSAAKHLTLVGSVELSYIPDYDPSIDA